MQCVSDSASIITRIKMIKFFIYQIKIRSQVYVLADLKISHKPDDNFRGRDSFLIASRELL